MRILLENAKNTMKDLSCPSSFKQLRFYTFHWCEVNETSSETI